ncbi:MAG: Mov34/MPN/PAD-1 family protein [bacterium]
MTQPANAVVIGKEERRALEEHARRVYPEECCGVLLGAFEGERKIVRASYPIDNARRDSARNRYLMSGDAVRGAEEAARRIGAEIVGYYHSHPDVPAVPSETDRREATWPIYSYVILSVRKGEIAELRSWTLTEDREAMNEETVLENS